MKRINHERVQLKKGDIKFLCGSSTTVEVIGFFDSDRPLCKILEAPTTSKFLLNTTHFISRRLLYAFNGRRAGKSPKMQKVEPPLIKLEL